MKSTRIALTMMALALLAGCGEPQDTSSGGGSGTSTSTGGAGTGGALPTGETYEFDTETYTVKPGEEVNYMCFTTRVPADAKMFITEVEPIYGKAIHHLGIYQTIGQDEPEGVFNCPELSRDNWLPIYGGGIESGTLKMPEGAALPVPAGGQILVQLHLLNTLPEEVTDKAHIIFHTTKTAGTAAGMFGFDNRDLHIPAQTNDAIEVQTCSPIGRDMDVFAVFGHMHQRGRKIEVSRGANPGDEVLYSAEWSFQDQPTVPANFHVSKTDTIHVRCWYDNPDSFEVNYGEKTANEMCSFVFYYTPFKSLFGCLKAPAP